MRSTIIASLFLALAATGVAQTSRLDEVVQYSVAGKKFMGSVLIARDDSLLLDQGYGLADVDRKTPNTPATRFRIGSLTKQFTAVGILLLEERGKLRLDDPIKNYLPDAPAAWEKITFFHLLTHSSGIPDLTAFPEIAAAQQNPATPAELVAYFRDKPLEFQPGGNARYSNSGFILLGYLIEKISGQSYAEFLQKNIFDPLGMADTGYDSTAVAIAPRALGYATGSQGIVPAAYTDMTRPFSAGGLYSTTHDLLRWQRQLYEGKLLQPASLKKMTTPIKHGPGLGIGVGFKPRKAYLHDGGIAGFESHLAYYPETKTSVIVLGNLDGVGTSDIVPKLTAVAFGETVVLPSERPAISLPREKLAQYAGDYQVSPTISLIISLAGEQLLMEVAGQTPKEPLFAASERKFFLRSEETEIEFLSNPKGEISALVAKGPGGRQLKAVRKR
jgi:CubicO group peptidase (beta-lactamase class C family)